MDLLDVIGRWFQKNCPAAAAEAAAAVGKKIGMAPGGLVPGTKPEDDRLSESVVREMLLRPPAEIHLPPGMKFVPMPDPPRPNKFPSTETLTKMVCAFRTENVQYETAEFEVVNEPDQAGEPRQIPTRLAQDQPACPGRGWSTVRGVSALQRGGRLSTPGRPFLPSAPSRRPLDRPADVAGLERTEGKADQDCLDCPSHRRESVELRPEQPDRSLPAVPPCGRPKTPEGPKTGGK